MSSSSIKITERDVVLSYPLTPAVKLDFVVDHCDTRSIGVSVIADGRYEPLLQEALLEVARDCKLFTDIGANAGFYSMAVRATNLNCKVIAFECNPEMVAVLSSNIERNALEGVVIRSEALSDSFGEAEFHVPAFTGSGGGSLRDLHPEEGEPRRFKVSLIPFDSLELESVDLMKIDVEGAELGVIKGAISSIEKSHPTIFIELLRKWMGPFGSTPADVSRVLTDMGYSIFEIREQEVVQVLQISDVTASTNFVFVHNSRRRHRSILTSLSR
jgi:FkbM family methyltransferase